MITPHFDAPDPVFDRVIVDYLMVGGARITWKLGRNFVDPQPYQFLLQGSNASAATTADDWFDIGTTGVNVDQLTDSVARLHGKTATLGYRVKLTTPRGVYTSGPADVLGKLAQYDWLIAREIVRKEQLRHQLFSSVPGWLLKARRYGTPCDCVDPFTGETTDSNCTGCYGTGFTPGYYAPVPYTFCEVSPSDAREHRDTQETGTQKTQNTYGRFIGIPELVQGDAFVCDGSDERYYIHTVKELATWRGVPLVQQAELRLAPFTDPLYTVPLTPDFVWP